MQNFSYYSPTKFIVGRKAEEKVGLELKAAGAEFVLVHYGQGSVVRSGLLARVCSSLEAAGLGYIELGGVRPNPEVNLVREGIALLRSLKGEGRPVDFILCVGGGSVIDSAKAISAGYGYEGDVWDFYQPGAPTEEILSEPLPLASVLTIPAAGSEASAGTVLSNDELQMKSSFGSPRLRPKLAFMNPELTMSLPAWQTAAGITDMYAHVCERFFSVSEPFEVTDNTSLGLFKTLVHTAPALMEDPHNYEARAEIMWAGTLCHCGLAGCGRAEDWSSHALEHELSALDTSVTHGAGLAVMVPAWMRYVYKQWPERFARYGYEVYGISPSEDPERDARAAIDATQDFFISLGMPRDLQELGFRSEDIPALLEGLAKNRPAGEFGSFMRLRIEDAARIYKSALSYGE